MAHSDIVAKNIPLLLAIIQPSEHSDRINWMLVMIHAALWLVSLIVVLAIGLPLLLLLLAAMATKTFWLIIGTVLIVLSMFVLPYTRDIGLILFGLGLVVAAPSLVANLE